MYLLCDTGKNVFEISTKVSVRSDHKKQMGPQNYRAYYKMLKTCSRFEGLNDARTSNSSMMIYLDEDF